MKTTPDPFVLILAVCWAANVAAKDVKEVDANAAIALPKDPQTVVLSYDPGAGGFIRKGAAPYLKIQANGQVTVTNVVDGSKKKSHLQPKQLLSLVRFLIEDHDFFHVTADKIDDAIKAAAGNGPFLAIGGAGTSSILVEANGKQHEVKYRGAEAYLTAYPKLKVLADFVAVEKRLSEFARSVEKGK